MLAQAHRAPGPIGPQPDAGVAPEPYAADAAAGTVWRAEPESEGDLEIGPG
jgi:hypothetical protein